ncbi:hypothetical protein BHE74_00047756 [Ensete ventricosum]|nr:hypothetical protein BHE74_00047756 [Ensete ventricosum]
MGGTLWFDKIPVYGLPAIGWYHRNWHLPMRERGNEVSPRLPAGERDDASSSCMGMRRRLVFPSGDEVPLCLLVGEQVAASSYHGE